MKNEIQLKEKRKKNQIYLKLGTAQWHTRNSHTHTLGTDQWKHTLATGTITHARMAHTSTGSIQFQMSTLQFQMENYWILWLLCFIVNCFEVGMRSIWGGRVAAAQPLVVTGTVCWSTMGTFRRRSVKRQFFALFAFCFFPVFFFNWFLFSVWKGQNSYFPFVKLHNCWMKIDLNLNWSVTVFQWDSRQICGKFTSDFGLEFLA